MLNKSLYAAEFELLGYFYWGIIRFNTQLFDHAISIFYSSLHINISIIFVILLPIIFPTKSPLISLPNRPPAIPIPPNHLHTDPTILLIIFQYSVHLLLLIVCWIIQWWWWWIWFQWWWCDFLEYLF